MCMYVYIYADDGENIFISLSRFYCSFDDVSFTTDPRMEKWRKKTFAAAQFPERRNVERKTDEDEKATTSKNADDGRTFVRSRVLLEIRREAKRADCLHFLFPAAAAAEKKKWGQKWALMGEAQVGSDIWGYKDKLKPSFVRSANGLFPPASLNITNALKRTHNTYLKRKEKGENFVRLKILRV